MPKKRLLPGLRPETATPSQEIHLCSRLSASISGYLVGGVA